MRKTDYHKILLTMSVIAFSMLSALADFPLTVGGVSDAPESSVNASAVNGPIGGGIIISQPNVSSKDAAVYYPYGMRYADLMTANADRYLFSGKELDRMNGLDIYDFHARQYDPLLGRFTSPDPMEEKYPHLSPYAYCAGNPIRFTDPTGKEIYISDSESQVHFKNSIREVFGEDFTNDFSFEDNGKLIFANSDAKNALSETQLEIFAGIDKLMNNNRNITINFIQANSDSELSKNLEEHGGGLYDYNFDRITIYSNYTTSFIVYPDGNTKGYPLGLPTEINMNTTTLLFHELGEAIVYNQNHRADVIKFENLVRTILDLPKRTTDFNHTNYNTIYE